jgi:hypothetical protein
MSFGGCTDLKAAVRPSGPTTQEGRFARLGIADCESELSEVGIGCFGKRPFLIYRLVWKSVQMRVEWGSEQIGQ